MQSSRCNVICCTIRYDILPRFRRSMISSWERKPCFNPSPIEPTFFSDTRVYIYDSIASMKSKSAPFSFFSFFFFLPSAPHRHRLFDRWLLLLRRKIERLKRFSTVSTSSTMKRSEIERYIVWFPCRGHFTGGLIPWSTEIGRSKPIRARRG